MVRPPPPISEHQSLQPRTGASPVVPPGVAASLGVRTKDHSRSSAEPAAPSRLSRDKATVWTWPGVRVSVLGALAPASQCPWGQPAVPFVQKLLRVTFQVPRIM